MLFANYRSPPFLKKCSYKPYLDPKAATRKSGGFNLLYQLRVSLYRLLDPLRLDVRLSLFPQKGSCDIVIL